MRNHIKPYYLWNNWQVELTGDYKHIDGDHYGQLYEEKSGRVIYGSSFLIDLPMNINNDIQYSEVEEDSSGSFNISAKVSSNNEVLSITISYLQSNEEEWARSVIKSARLLN